ncbi:kinase-like domain-containing protein [Suillus paluster]|uniref:kinase-like domain-containing protein n=1 Tax=Suillus paluster TaxID=48578 RepID=UPI001B86D0A2|nr:kinase-like domain-containing protein [Suillus paluster]KAG1723355.1 kinase-like domain-containing protein [Suillus paluster]
MQPEMDAQPGSSQPMLLGAFSPSNTTNFPARHRPSSPRPATRHRQHPYMPTHEKEPSAQRLPTRQRREHWQGLQTIPPNDTLEGKLAHSSTTTASAAGSAGVQQARGTSQQPQPQSASSALSLGMNPGVSACLTADRRSANRVAPDEHRVPTTGISVVPAPQGPYKMPNGIPHPQLTEKKSTIQSGPILPPTQEQLAHANDVIKNLKQVYSAKLPTMQLHALSDDHRMEYNRLLEQVHKMAQDLDVKLPMYWIVLRSDNMIRNLVAIVSLVAHQRASRLTESHLVIIDLSALKSMHSLLQKAIVQFEQRHQTMEAAVTPQQMGDEVLGLLLNRPSSPPTALNVTSTQPIPLIPIPDLTGLITRCSKDPVSGGTYGNIYKCIYHGPEGDVDVAVKAIRPHFFTAEVFRKELGIWKRLQHSNILKFIGTTSDFGPSVALVAPWILNGTLTSFLNEQNETLTPHDRLLLLRDVAAGLKYLHTFRVTIDGHTHPNPVVHGDLTGTNVLIGSDNTAYLADFGLSGTLTKLPGMTYLAKMSCRPGAVRWSAPELLSEEESGSAITAQSDIYSFGSIILQVLTGKVPWSHLSREAAILGKVIIEGEIHPRPDDDRVTDQRWNFMTRCWSKTPIDRPSAKEALQFIESELALYD